MRETLHIWPPFPIVIMAYDFSRGKDDIYAVLEHNDRIHQLSLSRIPGSQSENVLAAMHQQFQSLTCLELAFQDETAPVDPDLFLGGSAPGLQILSLDCIPVSGLPKILLSATHLVSLKLCRIPHSGYISPREMVACLSELTRLKSLSIDFESPQSRPDQNHRRPPSQTLTLPDLSEWKFKGAVDYLEGLVARINAPLLKKLEITFFHQLRYETPQLTRFISLIPKFKTFDDAFVFFSKSSVCITLDSVLEYRIICGEPSLQLSSLLQVCNSSFPRALISMVRDLYIFYVDEVSQIHWPDDESIAWLALFSPFTAVEELYLSRGFLTLIAPTFLELVEDVTDVLPALQALSLEEILPLESGPVRESVQQFVIARWIAGCPVSVSCWDPEEFL